MERVGGSAGEGGESRIAKKGRVSKIRKEEKMNRKMKKGLLVAVVLVMASFLAVGCPPPPDEPAIVFNSTQLRPAPETEWVMRTLLPPFEDEAGARVTFVPEEYAFFEDRIIGEVEAGRVKVSVAGGLHGDFSLLIERGFLTDLKGIELPDRTFIEAFWDLGFYEGEQVYVPWMQATYTLVANRKALEYLPPGADPYALTYEDLIAWARNMYEATGEEKFGLPVGPGGLIHRFVHGYIYPSYTGKTVANFYTPEAVTMWEDMKELWEYTHPSSPIWKAMGGPLLAEDVWVAWDHTARFKKAVVERPGDFVVLPSPAGPKGRGFITIIAGLAIPQGAPHLDVAKELIEYLTRPETQVKTAEGVGFFPVVEEAVGEIPEGPLRIIAEGVAKQADAPDAIVAMLPVGLGGRAGEFSRIFRDTFEAIVIRGEPIADVLAAQWAKLDTLYKETGAPYPLPG